MYCVCYGNNYAITLLFSYLFLQQIYAAFGGTSKGLGFKDLTCGLVLLTRGRQEEKIKCKYLLSGFVPNTGLDRRIFPV